MLRLRCKPYHVNQLTWLIICLIVLNVGANRLMRLLVLIKAIACIVVIIWSRWISPAEHSRSSFALVVSCVQVKIFFLFPVISTRDISGRSKLMRVGLRTGILKLRALMEVILFYGKGNVLNEREITSANSKTIFSCMFWLQTPFLYLIHEPNML
jgi:hypothetical protein